MEVKGNILRRNIELISNIMTPAQYEKFRKLYPDISNIAPDVLPQVYSTVRILIYDNDIDLNRRDIEFLYNLLSNEQQGFFDIMYGKIKDLESEKFKRAYLDMQLDLLNSFNPKFITL